MGLTRFLLLAVAVTRAKKMAGDSSHGVPVDSELAPSLGHPFSDPSHVASLEAEENICAICLDKLSGDFVHLSCGHQFHTACKTKLLESGMLRCPMCRRSWGRDIIIDQLKTLGTGNGEARANATAVLLNLTRNVAEANTIYDEGGIEALTKVLQDDSHAAQAHAAAALGFLAGNTQSRHALDLSIFWSDCIEALIKVLRRGSQEAQACAAFALFILAAGSPIKRALIGLPGFGKGGIQPLIKVLHNGTQDAQEYAAGALGYLAWGSDGMRDEVRDKGGIQALVKVLHDGSREAQRHAAYLLAELALDCQSQILIQEVGGIQALRVVLNEGDSQARKNAANALARLRVIRKRRNILHALLKAIPHSIHGVGAWIAHAKGCLLDGRLLGVRPLVKFLCGLPAKLGRQRGRSAKQSTELFATGFQGTSRVNAAAIIGFFVGAGVIVLLLWRGALATLEQPLLAT
eukprot:gnl/TRDRNA2_/TRDRNA2_69518_c0_seq1.p1 gnl/TRDRNA2_/TRDRNA2_69518_c0~~gnl/TRDRNA2_/TRDRNA2_69518_c0_seq1.p1  ORF type:complete len:462 (+),score=66.64 gnl/TRDRNA2_/TRDRNA2_69518_c0_seq1:51-1436(+)